MVKKALLLLCATVGLANAASAQWCITADKNSEYLMRYPQIAQFQQQLEQQTQMLLLSQQMFKTTDTDANGFYHIPVVVHIIHDYGATDYVLDNVIYELVKDINTVFAGQNPDLSQVIPPFQPYIGNPKIKFHLATKDPVGNPTKGITRRQSYLSAGGDDQAKFDQWDPSSYLNLWIVNRIGRPTPGGLVAAYATPPATAAALPFLDGVLANASLINNNKTIQHEFGHIFNLQHPWGGNNNVAVACGDDDVDDTPPTTGHFSTNAIPQRGGNCGDPRVLYDTSCTQVQTIISKVLIDSFLNPVVGNTTATIGFRAFSTFSFDSLYVYPETVGEPFSIELRKGSTVVLTINDTTITDTGRQRVLVNYQVIPDTYTLALTVNPGLYHDSAFTGYVTNIPLVVRVGQEITNNKYDYLYRWEIRHGYIKNGIDYPDTVNTQNIMDYADCPIMFTDLQVARMRASLQSSIGKRDSLHSAQNAVETGIFAPVPDLAPVADFSVERPNTGTTVDRGFYLCADGSQRFNFQNRSWRDTIDAVQWTFANGTPGTSTQKNGNVGVTTTTPGWMNVTLAATGNNSGTTTESRTPVYAASTTAMAPLGYIQSFEDATENERWPMFNYYNNNFKWEIVNGTGHLDQTCIRYNNYDDRVYPAVFTGTPNGDFDDFFTPAYDLDELATGNCNINFYTAGVSRTSVGNLMKDTLIISYSVNCGASWTTLRVLNRSDMVNNGVLDIPYQPASEGEWRLQSINLPTAARTERTFFRFRYRPGVEPNSLIGTGNHFYLDRISVSNNPLGTGNLLNADRKIALAPNPTNGGSTILIKGSTNGTTANVVVTDVTGKVVYRTQQALSGNVTSIEIPANAITVKGMYVVQIVTGEQTHTEKLVVY